MKAHYLLQGLHCAQGVAHSLAAVLCTIAAALLRCLVRGRGAKLLIALYVSLSDDLALSAAGLGAQASSSKPLAGGSLLHMPDLMFPS